MNIARARHSHWGFLLFAALLCSCTGGSRNAEPKPPASTPGGRVLVVANRRSADGIAVANYYMQRRAIPAAGLLLVDVTTDDDVSELDFDRAIASPVRDAIARLPQRIDFILLTTGIPLRLGNRHGYSVDARLAGMRLAVPPMVGFDTTWIRRYHNPYYGATEPFSSDRFGMYLVTRLDCAERAQCLALVDRSMDAQPYAGPFLFDAQSGLGQTSSDLRPRETMLVRTHQRLLAMGAQSILDTSPRFVGFTAPLAGYVSWGSNDAHYDSTVYHALRFLPGALAETFVSTSARTFKPVQGGQSRIVDLIAQGVTGVKGYVSEPYSIALAEPELLFDRYLRGFTLAEAFYASSRMVLWKDVVIGDPLCAPYRTP